jgi:3-mercaptopyruvate sulfurtransferase SseA
LEEYDFKEIHILTGGINAWCDAGLPMEKKRSAVSFQPSAKPPESKLPAENDD